VEAVLQQTELNPRYAASSPFSAEIPVPDGLIRGIGFFMQGTTVDTTALQDDVPERLIADVRITFPLRGGDVVMTWLQRDALLISQYLTASIAERTTPATAGAFDSYFYLPFGPAGWGFPKSAFRTGEDIRIEGTYAAVLEYGASTSAITAGIVRPELLVDYSMASVGRALTFARSRIPVESAARDPQRRLSRPDGAFGLWGVYYRQEDTSAAADRPDGLVTRIDLIHGAGRKLHDTPFRQLRQKGLRDLGIPRNLAVAASPEGLDGTAMYVAAPTFADSDMPDLQRSQLAATVDSAEGVPFGTTDVTPAAGDALHVVTIGALALG